MIHIKTAPSVGVSGPTVARLSKGCAALAMRGLTLLLGIGIGIGIGLAAALAAGRALAQDAAQPRLDTVVLTAGMHRITAEVAATPMQQAIGLMYRREMGANDGMLFVYDSPQRLCFWMRNTLLPLTIAFLDDDGRVVNLRDMQPLDETSQHCADKPVRYALEMHQGWFDKRGLKPGFRLRGAPFRP